MFIGKAKAVLFGLTCFVGGVW